MLTIGNYLLDSLFELGVKDIFGLPGDYVIRFDKLIEQHRIRFVNTTRENTAGYMADAYARLKGIGAACITYGVGINIVNAVSQAFVEDSPVVIISGAAGTEEHLKSEKLHHLINKSSRHTLDRTQLEIFRHITVDQAVLDDPFTAKGNIDRVLQSCVTYKKPVYLELPRNCVDLPLPEQGLVYPAPKLDLDTAALAEALADTENLLAQSTKPVLWIGHEIQRYDLANDLLKFAERAQIPIVSSLLGKTAISETHPLFQGVYFGKLSRPEVSKFMDERDCVLMLGVMVNDIDTGIFTAKLDYEKKIEASVEGLKIKHHQYLNVRLSDFVKGLASSKTPLKPFSPLPAKENPNKFVPRTHTRITTERFFSCLQSHLTSQHIVVADVGDSLFGSADLILAQNSFLACAYFASLGFATPAAVAAQIVEPTKRVIAIVGDGAFQMTSMELSTAVRYRADPIILVLNNHGYGTERPLLEGTYNDILDWNYTEIPKVLGAGIGIRTDSEEDLQKALKTALSKRGTFYLIQIDVGKTDFSTALRRLGEFSKV